MGGDGCPEPCYQDSMSEHFDWAKLLTEILAEFTCQTGTIHRASADGTTLHLVTQIGVPESLMDKISVIPFGKGIVLLASVIQGLN